MKLTALTDIEKWALFKKGDEGAFSFIYSEYSESLYRYGLKFTPDTSLVEDAMHDLFAELLKNRKKLGTTDNILFYLLKSFKRKLLRKIYTEKRYDVKEEMEDYRFDVTWSAEHELILEEDSEKKSKLLAQALKKLTPRQKEAIYLRFTKELDYKEVAGLMDISVEACRNLISKAISTLKKWISEKEGGPAVFFAMIFLK